MISTVIAHPKQAEAIAANNVQWNINANTIEKTDRK
jgi:hypothetical protein